MGLNEIIYLKTLLSEGAVSQSETWYGRGSLCSRKYSPVFCLTEGKLEIEICGCAGF